jgi:hypothetical protein
MHMTIATTPLRVRILLATRNGAAHLSAQLASYLAQDHTAWDLWVSDDGSEDDTLAILQAFRDAHGRGRDIRILSGPQRGSAANFLSLLCHPDLPPGPVALSDQDDVWLPHKLRRAVAALQGAGAVALYGGQSLHVDADLRITGRSKLGQARPAFSNALTQNIVSGHSTVLSAGALDLVRRAGPQKVPHHDWWLYQLVSAAGGDVLIDPEPVLHYRQHGANVMGAHQGFRALAERAAQVMGRDYGNWIATNLDALNTVDNLLSAPNRALVKALRAHPRPDSDAKGRARAAWMRARCMWQHGLYRQGRVQTVLFYIAVVLGRV